MTQLFPGALYTQPALLVSAFFLGLASQGIKIVVDTLVQTHVDDVFRGRVFSLYDVIFNVAFVAAAAVGAVVLPDNGKSYVVLGAVAVGYLLTAVWYAQVTRVRRSRHRLIPVREGPRLSAPRRRPARWRTAAPPGRPRGRRRAPRWPARRRAAGSASGPAAPGCSAPASVASPLHPAEHRLLVRHGALVHRRCPGPTRRRR